MRPFYTPFSFTAKELFDTFNLKQLKVRQEICESKYGCNRKQYLCAKILQTFFQKVILDIIQNNVTFMLPLFNGKKAMFYVRPLMGEEFAKARQNGAQKDIDILASEFTGYEFCYEWEAGHTPRRKRVYLSGKYRDMLIEQVNKGKKYY